MPEMSGLELAAELRNDYPDIRVLFASGYTADFFSSGKYRVAAGSILEKPFVLETLARKVRQVLDESAEPLDHT